MIVSDEIIVRFCETDMYGHVNNTSYFIYLEIARSNFFKKNLSDRSKATFVAASLKCDYIKPAYFEQRLIVKTDLLRVGKKSVELQHTILNKETNEILAEGRSVEVYFNTKKKKSENIPDDMLHHFEKLISPEEKVF